MVGWGGAGRGGAGWGVVWGGVGWGGVVWGGEGWGGVKGTALFRFKGHCLLLLLFLKTCFPWKMLKCIQLHLVGKPCFP